MSETDAEFVERIKREWDGDNVPCVEDFDQLIALARRGAEATARIEQLEATIAAMEKLLEQAGNLNAYPPVVVDQRQEAEIARALKDRNG